MAGRIIFKVTRGALAGQTFEYGEKTRIFIGRQEDCGIVVPENTVSRYHCVLEITPPEVKLQDFGSLNGTFLNGEKIGQRDRAQSWEEAKDEEREEFTLHNGDVLGLGSKCELRCVIEGMEVCAACGAMLPEGVSGSATIPEGEERAPLHYSVDGKRICEDCWLIAEKERLEKRIAEKKGKEAAERKAAEEARIAAEKAEQDRKEAERKQKEAQEKKLREDAEKAKAEAERVAKEKADKERIEKEALAAAQKAEADRKEAERLAREMAAKLAARPKAEQKKCGGCGKPFTPKAPDNNLCPECLADRAKVLDGILRAMLGGAQAAKPEEKPIGPSPVKGYQKVKLLGKGGMGEVWKVRDEDTGKYYALKTMLPAVQADENAVKLFLREASVAQALKHKNVVTTYQSGSANGVFYILMDLCEGGSVDGLMEKKGGKLSLEQASWIILQILSGLDYVHNVDLTAEIRKGIFKGTMDAQGVVHRDFKPGNIFLSDHSEMPVAMVADFGMAKAFDAAGLSRITKTGTVMGTPVFMPRQQAIDFKYAKPEVDVWAAAASFYNMLTGAFPKNFRPGKNVWQIIVSEPAVPIRDRNAAIPQQLAAVIDKALREQPEIGYKSAAAFRKDIIAALPGNVKNAVKGVI
jgi:serine/threonine-protein kinase